MCRHETKVTHKNNFKNTYLSIFFPIEKTKTSISKPLQSSNTNRKKSLLSRISLRLFHG